MKKVVFMLVALFTVAAAHAQFEEGKVYCGASLSGLNLSYNGAEELNLGLDAKVGYMFDDNLMLLGLAGYNHNGREGAHDSFTLGAQGRYYMSQNGLYLGAGVKLVHANSNYNDVMPGIELGYSFFVSRTVAIEPALYYDQSFKNHSDYSTIGVRVGVGIYL